MKIGIVEDHFLNRKILREKILGFENINLVIEAENGEDFLTQMASIAAEDQPQVILMDREMPVLDGLSTIALSSVKYPKLKYIVLTIFEDNDKIFEAIRLGASGYLLKDDTATDIIDAMKNVIEHDGIPMSPAIARRAMQLLSNASPPAAEHEKIEDYRLSARETEVLKAIIQGNSPLEIAEMLFISPNTVRTHVNNIYSKLHLNSRAQIIKLAHKNKWI